MGRTLHYNIKFEKPLDMVELAFLENICDNSRKVRPMGYDPKEFSWTCENFGIDPFDYYPNWPVLKRRSPENSGKLVDDRYKVLRRSMKNGDALKVMQTEGLIVWANEGGPAATFMRGFTKVQGNELNAMWVVYTLLTISRAFPTAVISCSDEGRYLRCPIKLKAGLAQLDLERFEKDITDQSCRIVGALLRKGTVLGDNPTSALPVQVQTDLFSGAYSIPDIMGWIRKLCDDAAWPIHRMAEELAKRPAPFAGSIPPHLSNLSNVWIGVENFHRPVVAAHFSASSRANFSETMSGFYGEHWKLEPDKDAKAETLKMLKFVCKVTGAKPSDLRVGVSI